MNKNEIPDVLNDYLDVFDKKNQELEETIFDLEKEIDEIKKELRANNRKLKERTSDIDTKKKQVNMKLHEVSGDYSVDDLLEAAEQLKDLSQEREDIEEEIKGQSDALSEKLEESENKKNDTTSIKSKVIDVKKNAEVKLQETYNGYKAKLDAINKALEVCDNENLRKALEEEKDNMEASLEEVFSESERDLGNIIGNISKSESSMGKIDFEENVKAKKVTNKKELSKSKKIEIENPEPNFTEVIEEKIETNDDSNNSEEEIIIPIKTLEEKEEDVFPIPQLDEIPEPTVTEEEVYDESREIINKVDASDKAELVKGSDQVRNSIDAFFANI